MDNNVNKFYVPLIMALGMFTCLLNLTSKAYECALIAVLLCLTTNIITTVYGRKKAIKSVILCAVASLLFLWNFNYYIHDRIIHGLVIASLLSVIVSTYCSTGIFAKYRPVLGFNVSNLISLMACAVVDGLFMATFFINKYPIDTVLSISMKEVSFKCLYSLALCLFIYLITLTLNLFQGSTRHAELVSASR